MDRSLTHPPGIIEDVLVKVDIFIFPANFIFLDVEVDKEIPIILGRPFLAMGRALIYVQKGELRLRVQEEEVTFNVFNAIKHPNENDSCFSTDVVEAIVSSKVGQIDPLETTLLHENFEDLEEDEQMSIYCRWILSGLVQGNTLKLWEHAQLILFHSLKNHFRPTLDILTLEIHLLC